MIQLKLCTFVAIGATSPYWLWQIWAFILPGLNPRERKWSWVFIAVAGPLFMRAWRWASTSCPRAWRS